MERWLCIQSRLQLLDRRLVVLEIAVLEEDQVVVSVRFNAVFAERISALVARTFDLFALMPGLLAEGDSFAAIRRIDRLRCVMRLA